MYTMRYRSSSNLFKKKQLEENHFPVNTLAGK